MARFYGAVGFGDTIEVETGVWEDIITERMYFGDIVRNARQFRESDRTVINDVFIQNSISIVADGFAWDHFSTMRYVVLGGARWTVEGIEIQRPRLVLRLGEVYNGPTAVTP